MLSCYSAHVNHGDGAPSKLIAAAHLASGPGYEQHIRVGHHSLVADEPAALGGNDAGPTPFQLVLSGLGACTAITLAMYAERKGFELGALKVDLKLFFEDDQRRIERVIGFDPALDEQRCARLLEIAEKTPVTKALRAGFAIETTRRAP